LSEGERAALVARAGGIPLGTYLKNVLVADLGRTVRKPRAVTADHALLGRVLAVLGSSRLSSNLNQLAKAVNLGVLPVSEETEADLRAACRDVADMRACLLGALGVRAGGGLTGVPEGSGGHS
jgi:hypothetical protein